MNTEHALLKNQSVEVSSRISDEGDVSAHIIVGGRHEHTFTSCSRISQYLGSGTNADQMEAARTHLESRLSGGSYFFVNNELADFRDNQYAGFTHTDAAIDKLIELIGIETDPSKKLRSSLSLTTPVSNIALLGRAPVEGFHIPGYLEGGAFTSGLIHSWSPFTSYIKTVYEIVRQICTNGAIASSDLINTKIPLVNRWEEHLAIAERQIQNAVVSNVTRRLASMGTERATVLELMKLVEIGRARLEDAIDVNEINRIHKLIHTVDPETHLANYYNPIVFDDSASAARAAGHLTTFDTWNVATEMFSHTTASAGGSDNQLQRFANGLLFPKKDSRVGRGANVVPQISSFSDPDQAFFGVN